MSPDLNELWRLLSGNPDLVDEILTCYNISTTFAALPADLPGFVYVSRRGRYHIIVSSNLTKQHQLLVFFHELYHIVVDMPQQSYVIGLDQEHHPRETNADAFARMIVRCCK